MFAPMDAWSTPRLVTVWCPDWPIAAACMSGAVAADEPAAVLRSGRVVARSAAAARAGVVAGQLRRQAQRCCPELTLVDHDPGRDARSFEPVVRSVAEMVPRLDLVEPGWLTFAARGPSRYFGGDTALAERLVGLVHELTGAPVGVGVADGRVTSAIAARRAVIDPVGARSGGVEVVEPGGSAGYLAPLPVTWLRELGDADAASVDVWVRLGLRTMGALAALPVAEVAARFGRAGELAHRLARGDDARPPVVADPVPDRRVEHTFGDPVVSVSPVVFVAKQLADRLIAELAAEGRVCARLLVTAETEHGERTERTWYRDAGFSAPAVVERVRWQLDAWIGQPGGISAGIIVVRLEPVELRAADGVQAGLWGGRSQADEDAVRAVARLSALCGAEAVRVPVWRGGRLPAERYGWVPAATADLDDPSARLAEAGAPWSGAITDPAPTVVPTEPLEVELLDRHGHRVSVGGRGELGAEPVVLAVGGARHTVTAWAGPWPVEQAWWDPRRARRIARLEVLTDDGVARLVGAEHRRWWVLGEYR